MGLQYKDSCFCGTTYDKVDGTGRLDTAECDIDGDTEPDCGMSLDGTGMANPNACVWRNAVFDLSPQVRGRATPAVCDTPASCLQLHDGCRPSIAVRVTKSCAPTRHWTAGRPPAPVTDIPM